MEKKNTKKKEWTEEGLERLKKGTMTPEKEKLIKKVEEDLKKKKSSGK
ncbi:MAG: hypothetical protein ACO1N0_16775 [Fluviicola sp.]